MSMYYQVERPSRSEFIPIRLQRYHVRLWGQSGGARPPLVLVHGWMDVAASYQFMVDAFSADFLHDRLVIAPDWRGFGQTTGPACDHFAFADYLGDLDALLDHYAGERPVDLVGHSMGGNVVMQYAAARPARLRRLVNLEGFGLPAADATQAPARLGRWLDELRQLRTGALSLKAYPSADAVAARLMKTNPRLPAPQAAWLAQQWAQPDAQGQWRILGEAAHKVVNPQLFRLDEMLALYAAITVPVLAVQASDDSLARWWDGRYTLAQYHQRLQHVAHCRSATVADAGHMLHHDQPRAVAALLESFLTAPSTACVAPPAADANPT